MKNTIQKILVMIIVAAMILSTFGCATMKEHKVASGAVIGGVVGAAAGAAIDSDNRGRGAAIGAGVGAAAGAGVGYLLARQAARYDKIDGVDVTKVPEEKNEVGQVVEPEHLNLKISTDVLFSQNSSALTTTGSEKLADVAAVLKDYPDNRVVVIGYTSDEGTDAYNMDLSSRRAAVVKNELIRRGVSSHRIEAIGMGESNPVADNDTEWGRSQNRRVEIEVFPTK